jgi:hypothetical protein
MGVPGFPIRLMLNFQKDEFRSFQEKLYMAITARETLVSPAVVFAELMPQFQGDKKQISLFLKQHKIGVEPLDLKAVSIAGERWMKYLKKNPKPLVRIVAKSSIKKTSSYPIFLSEALLWPGVIVF